jgi:nucleoside-diphosphate-sugar epimerase
MRLLILGGTAFLGRAVARHALARGHEVTCVARGVSGRVADGVRLVRADREDPAAGLGGVEDETWDCVVEVSRQPGQVRRAAQWLAPRAAHAVFVSTVSVYAASHEVGADESAAVLPPLDGDVSADLSRYGEAKVACERHLRAAFGDERVLVARAGLIGGPGDVSGRSGYWPWRLAHPSNPGGEVLVPDVADAPCQILDVRDLAGWIVGCGEDPVAGTVDAVGDIVPFGEVIDTARLVAGHPGRLVAAPSPWLVERGVEEWMGPRSLPLWIADPEEAAAHARPGAAGRALGLVPRPLVQTLRAALDWEESRPAGATRLAGLTDAEELELLGALPRG